VVPSTDGHGELPQRQIDEGLARDALVHYGFDNDAGGATLWAQVFFYKLRILSRCQGHFCSF